MQSIWSTCLTKLQAQTAPEIYRNWFSDIDADESEIEKGRIRLKASSSAKAKSLQMNYGERISAIVQSVFGKPVEILWQSQEPEHIAAPAKTAPTVAVVQKPASIGLLPNLTFENLVSGKANQLAFAAALRVANSTNAIYNPMVIYGGVGLGKTHLMHAIGHLFLKNHPGAKVLCISAQQYLEEFTGAIHQLKNSSNEQAMRKFESKYQNLDLLLVDDIQSFASRTGTQASFFQVFENMVPHGKQIVMTSDTYPRNIKDLQERFSSRMTQGLIVEIEPPELELRIGILHQKAANLNLEMPDNVAEVIAKHLKSNVRELEGAVQQIHAFTNFHQVPVTLDTAQQALRDVFRTTASHVTVEEIQKIVSEHYNLKLTEMQSKKRSAPIAKARQVAMYLAKELTQKSLPEIGALFGGRDHTTVLYATKKITEARRTDEALRHDLHILEQRIKN